MRPAPQNSSNAIGSGKDESGNDALFKRMAEVAVRRVARKRGVAVDTPQTKTESGVLIVNVTYIDDGRVLDTPEDLTSAFEHAISTEIALKGLEAVVDINLFRSKDGAIDKIGSDGEAASPVEDSDEEMFACEVCDGLVKESDKECPHCGAIFEEEEDEAPARGPPGRGGPPGPKQGGLRVLSEVAHQVHQEVEAHLRKEAQAEALQVLREAAHLVAAQVEAHQSEAVLLAVAQVVEALQSEAAHPVLNEAVLPVLSVAHQSDPIFHF